MTTETLFAGRGPLIVGPINGPDSLKIALNSKLPEVDLFEIRADLWWHDLDTLHKAVPRLKKPFILTVRHRSEGGNKKLSQDNRRRLFFEFLMQAAAVDVEERSLSTLRDVVREVRHIGCRLIVSYHDFKGTPPLTRMKTLASRAHQARADVFKLAVTPRNAEDLARLITFVGSKSRVPLAVMGMGPLGKMSRLVCASLGSVLNYSYLDQSFVPGQWPARELRARLAEIAPA